LEESVEGQGHGQAVSGFGAEVGFPNISERLPIPAGGTFERGEILVKIMARA
jgi:hypothetical protein